MFKTISIAILSALIINVIGFNLYNMHVERQFEGQDTTHQYVSKTLQELKANILEVRSLSSVSRLEFESAAKSENLESVKYEVSMNKASVQSFVDKLNEDINRLNIITNINQDNALHFEEKIQLLLNKVQVLEDKVSSIKEPMIGT